MGVSKTVYNLSQDELIELKEKMLIDKNIDTPSYAELTNADELVSDEEVFAEFDGITFTDEDFFCNTRDTQKQETSEDEPEL